MFKTIAPLQEVLEHLVAEGLITAAGSTRIADLSDTPSEAATPWYIRGLIGLGGWFAALFFIGFLTVAEIITDSTGAMIVGAIFCVVGVGIKGIRPTSVFAGQLALAISLAGQLMFIFGFWDKTNNVPLTIIVTIGLETLLFIFYADKLHRFLSAVVICWALFWLFIDLEVADLSHLLVILLAGGTILLWHFQARLVTSPLSPYFRPLGYALPVALFGFLLLSFTDDYDIKWWWLSAVGLLAALYYLEYLVLDHHRISWRTTPVVWVLTGTLLLLIPAIQTPGILAALIVLLVGYYRGNRLLLGLATAFLAIFLIGYYYNLELTLLTKSFVLMGTGLILLVIRYVAIERED
ncbi:MAG: DUF4401 domain-containing protein [Anaerolineae bacterium]|nr:DUF4401 domain-containing protein [Anaerolineae bacterium]